MQSLEPRPEVAEGARSHSKRVLHLGGPGEPDRALRDVLAARVRAVPSGGRIVWVTYYFRDRGLAQDLVDAHRRGVDVRVLLEGRPRARGANRHVLALLQPVLGAKLRVVVRPHVLRVHAKIYLFDGPERRALIGSFNPSGDAGDLEPQVVQQIGDQDRGFNLLVELGDAALFDWLLVRTERLHAGFLAPLSWPRAFASDTEVLWLLPRFRKSPLLERLAQLTRGARVRVAATHLSGRIALRHLSALAARGVHVEALAESTERRVPRALETGLREAGVVFTRVEPAEHLPMHAKFTLIEDRGVREAWFGSANWSDRSLQRNFEALVRSRDPELFDALSNYWERIERFANETRTERG